MLAPETLDTIVEFLSGDFCATTGEDRCPEFVDVVIRQGLPMIYAASDDAAVAEVSFLGNLHGQICRVIKGLKSSSIEDTPFLYTHHMKLVH